MVTMLDTRIKLRIEALERVTQMISTKLPPNPPNYSACVAVADPPSLPAVISG